MNKLINEDGLITLRNIESNSVDFILTDPPYITSRKSGMNDYYNLIKDNPDKISDKFGSRFAVKTDYGEWDSEFTLEVLNEFVKEFHRILRKGGSCVVFFDFWKMESLKNMLESAKFSKLRLIDWIKTNPMPTNQYATYLNGAREMAISCVKGSKATFNSKYDKGIYEYPIYQGVKGIDRFHPTQKPLDLFCELIKKHSNEGDLVVDPFSGSGTTHVASMITNRKSICSEINKEYFNNSIDRANYHKSNLKLFNNVT